MNFHLPKQLTDERRWCVWRFKSRGQGKPTKVPYHPNGQGAKSNDPDTWVYHHEAAAACEADTSLEGVGFFLTEGWSGVDLDDCLNEDGDPKPWAADIIESLDSYTEVSPSGNGVKIFVRGTPPEGKQKSPIESGTVEMYGRQGRYFTVTGNHFAGSPYEIRERSSQLQTVHAKWIAAEVSPFIEDPVVEMKKHLDAMPESVMGQNGSDIMILAACEIRRWGFDGEEGRELLEHYNQHRAHPPWEGEEFDHKWESAVTKVPIAEVPRIKGNPHSGGAFDLALIPDTDFAVKSYDQDFLVQDLVVQGEHLIIGGPKKSLKTSILVDIAVSVAAGNKQCLGAFATGDPKPVIVVSGESGGATLQKTAARIRTARGCGPLENLHWGLRLPNLTLTDHLEALKRDIDRTGAVLAAIDPAYLALMIGDEAKNVFQTGQVLNGFGRIGAETGCTLCLVHHTTKGLKMGQLAGLEHLSMSGFAEWARQWILLNHSKPYSQGRVELKASVGGSAGHGSTYLWNIDQGARQAAGLGWTDWQVTVEDREGPDFTVETEEDKACGIVEAKLRSEPSREWTKSDLYNKRPTFAGKLWHAIESRIEGFAEIKGEGRSRRYQLKPQKVSGARTDPPNDQRQSD